VPTSALDYTLWLESDRMGHLLGAIDQKTLDLQRGVVQNEKRQGENQPYDMKSGGRIIMIGSCVGERVMTPGLVPYSATKGAIKMFTQGLAREVGGRGLTVNNIQPGPIDTELNPAAGDWAVPQKAATALDRYGTVEEVAALVAFIAGPESSYITGANLTVDGGTNA
jgi:3-oxoacyl-[acyl-carrier protein] reductase